MTIGEFLVKTTSMDIQSATEATNKFMSSLNRIKLLREYTQFLYDRGYLDDDWIFEAPSPIDEFLKDYKD